MLLNDQQDVGYVLYVGITHQQGELAHEQLGEIFVEIELLMELHAQEMVELQDIRLGGVLDISI